jgi:hypothetical protein
MLKALDIAAFLVATFYIGPKEAYKVFLSKEVHEITVEKYPQLTEYKIGAVIPAQGSKH